MTNDARGRLRVVLPWLVVGVVMVALAAVAVVRLVGDDAESPSEARSVRDVAEMAVVVAESMDIDGGMTLLCDEPLELYPMVVSSTFERWRALTGAPAPEVLARASEVDDGSTGSFLLRVSSEEDGMADEGRTFQVFVESRDGRSCVVGVGGRQADAPTVRFAREGYSGVTSPTPAPTPASTATSDTR